MDALGSPSSAHPLREHLDSSPAGHGLSNPPRPSLADSEWLDLPTEVVLQLHWRRGPAFGGTFNGTVPDAAVARHPLDVLISILHFCLLRIRIGTRFGCSGPAERSRGSSPRCPEPTIHRICTRGPRADTGRYPNWWGQPRVFGRGYEDFATRMAMQRIEAVFGPVRCVPLRAGRVEACSLARLREQTTNNHFWKGSPGLWRSLLPPVETAEIAPALSPFDARYSCERTQRSVAELAEPELGGAGRRRDQANTSAKYGRAWARAL